MTELMSVGGGTQKVCVCVCACMCVLILEFIIKAKVRSDLIHKGENFIVIITGYLVAY